MTHAEAPDPLDDPEGYALWQEIHACAVCDGIGEDIDDGETWVCDHCDGTGIEPGMEVDDDDTRCS